MFRGLLLAIVAAHFIAAVLIEVRLFQSSTHPTSI